MIINILINYSIFVYRTHRGDWMKKRIISAVLSVIVAATAAAPAGIIASADTYEEQLKKAGFTAEYIPSLVALHEKYPNWKFKALLTNVDFTTAVSQERTPHSQQLIQKYSANNNKGFYCTCSKCYKNGSYVIQEGSSWVSASQAAVEYYMNPTNFLSEKYIFQFESTSYDSSQTVSGVETIIKSTWMANSKIYYLDSKGNSKLVTTSVYPDGPTYSQTIMEAAKNSGLSSYYLASKIVQEVGGKTNSATGACGTNSKYPGIYNYYNIGAYTGGLDGLKWAATSTATSGGTTYKTKSSANMRTGPSTSTDKATPTALPSGTSLTFIEATEKQADGYVWYKVSATLNGTSYTGYIRSDLVSVTTTAATTDKYNRPWTSPFISIYQGAKYIATNFSTTQNTGYLQKFNVNPNSTNRYNHEYMANVQAAVSEALTSYNAYKTAGLLSSTKTFIIPVYKSLKYEKVYTWKESGGNYYLYDQYEVVQTGMNKVDGKWYYTDSTGKRMYGWQKFGDNYRYFGTDGVMATELTKVDGKWYYFNSSTGFRESGWKQINTYWRYFGEDGVMLTGLSKIEGKWYYLNSSGVRQTGWITFGENKRYFGTDGAMATGLAKVGGKWHCFDASTGFMQFGWQQTGKYWRYFDEDGVMQTGLLKIDGKWYYLNDSGIRQSGWVQAGNYVRYFNEDGIMQTGLTVIDGSTYYLSGAGVAQTGWIDIDGNMHYFKADGAMATGLTKIDGKWYYFNGDGAKQTGWQQTGKYWRYFDEDGVMLTGLTKIDGKWYSLTDSGIRQSGWVQTGKYWRYFDANGVMLANTTQKIDGTSYTFNANGICTNK